MNRWCIGSVFVTLLWASVTGAVVQKSRTDEKAARALNAQGLVRDQAGDEAGARTIFEQVMKQYPTTQEARLSVQYAADTYGEQGQFAQARQYLEGLATQTPQGELNAWLQYFTLRYLNRLQAFDNLAQKADRLATTSPESFYAPFALLDKGIMQLYGLQDVAAARMTFQSIVDRYPTSEAASTALAYLYPMGQPPKTQPISVMLRGNAPNPFNPQTTISFTLSQPVWVELVIYNMLGQTVRHLVRDQLPAGAQTVVWDGRSDAGQEVGTGIYLYRLTAGEFTTASKMLLLR